MKKTRFLFVFYFIALSFAFISCKNKTNEGNIVSDLELKKIKAWDKLFPPIDSSHDKVPSFFNQPINRSYVTECILQFSKSFKSLKDSTLTISETFAPIGLADYILHNGLNPGDSTKIYIGIYIDPRTDPKGENYGLNKDQVNLILFGKDETATSPKIPKRIGRIGLFVWPIPKGEKPPFKFDPLTKTLKLTAGPSTDPYNLGDMFP